MATPRKKNPKPGGRPQFNGKPLDIVIQKLEEVWALGGTDAEAAFYADISKASLSDYLKRHPEIAERKAALLQKPVLMARKAVINAFDGEKVQLVTKDGKEVTVTRADPEMALKYLERKHRQEFSLRSEVDHSGHLTLENLITGSMPEPEK
jgi:hypothetical protein